jgi:hypothetical protein
LASKEKSLAELTEAAEEQVFLLTYHQGFHRQSLSFADCTIESGICDKQMKEKCTMEW